MAYEYKNGSSLPIQKDSGWNGYPGHWSSIYTRNVQVLNINTRTVQVLNIKNVLEEDYYAKYRWITMQNKGGLLCKIEVHYYAK